jgi:hypothetical protein
METEVSWPCPKELTTDSFPEPVYSYAFHVVSFFQAFPVDTSYAIPSLPACH